MKSNQTREWIISCATNLFMTKGYDAISIHEILKAANCSVSLFYYYFSSKDELFNECLHSFLKNYEETINTLLKNIDFDSPKILFDIFINITIKNKDKLENHIHWTFLNSLRTYYLTLTTEACKRILVEGAKKNMYNITTEEASALSYMLGNDICSAILYQTKEEFSSQYNTYIKYMTGILENIKKDHQ